MSEPVVDRFDLDEDNESVTSWLKESKTGYWVKYNNYKDLHGTNELLTSLVDQHITARENLIRDYESLLTKYRGVFGWLAKTCDISVFQGITHSSLSISERIKAAYEDSLK